MKNSNLSKRLNSFPKDQKLNIDTKEKIETVLLEEARKEKKKDKWRVLNRICKKLNVVVAGVVVVLLFSLLLVSEEIFLKPQQIEQEASNGTDYNNENDMTDGTEKDTFEGSVFPIPENIKTVYNEFSGTKSEETLSDLTPIEIVMLYYYTEDLEDYETLYYLHVQNKDKYIVTPKKDYISSQNRTTETRQSFLDELREDLIKMEQVILDDNVARVKLIYQGDISSKTFQLVKENGSWKARWMPLQ